MKLVRKIKYAIRLRDLLSGNLFSLTLRLALMIIVFVTAVEAYIILSPAPSEDSWATIATITILVLFIYTFFAPYRRALRTTIRRYDLEKFWSGSRLTLYHLAQSMADRRLAECATINEQLEEKRAEYQSAVAAHQEYHNATEPLRKEIKRLREESFFYRRLAALTANPVD